MTQTADRVLSRKEVAKRLNCSEWTVWRIIARGDIETMTLHSDSNRRVVTERSLDRYIERRLEEGK